jgi:hypothetical protein
MLTLMSYLFQSNCEDCELRGGEVEIVNCEGKVSWDLEPLATLRVAIENQSILQALIETLTDRCLMQ